MHLPFGNALHFVVSKGTLKIITMSKADHGNDFKTISMRFSKSCFISHRFFRLF